MNARLTSIALSTVVAVSAVGCISVKTESEVKPIHITMDVNLKVDKELDKAFADEDRAKPTGNFKSVKDALDRQAIGIDNKGMYAARSGATDDERILVAEENGRRRKRFETIAKEGGVSYEAVCRRRAKQMVERMPAGKGVWYQDESGKWLQK